MVLARAELTFFTEAHMVLCFCVFFFNENSADNTPFQVLQSSLYTEPRTFQLFMLPCQQGAVGHEELR